MKVGALVRNFGGYPETGRSARACIDFAREIERTGFDSIWVTDHIVLPKAREAVYPHDDSGRFPYRASVEALEILSETVLPHCAGLA